jgi:hypothetical protein
MYESKIKALVILAVVALMALPLVAQRGDDADRASKNGRTEGEIDGVGVVLEYGRPQVKDREIWGDLVPYGEVWRTGANEATTISFSDDVTIEGQALPAGTYSLFTIPTEAEWTVIFNKVPNQWGHFRYDAGEDALRVTVEPGEGEFVEEMDFVIDGSSVVLRWENLSVAFDLASG